jgi:hypothetical protein
VYRLVELICVVVCALSIQDHTGVPNSQLVKEGAEIANIYKEKSVAEQNSIGKKTRPRLDGVGWNR